VRIEAFRADDHGNGIAEERPVGEDVDLLEGKRCHRARPKLTANSGSDPDFEFGL
jgi:hypothetical protein